MSQTRIFHCLIVNLLICRGEASLPTAKHDSWVPESVGVQPKAACQRQPFAKSLGQSKALRHDVAVTVTKPAQLSQNAERLRSCRKLRGKCHEDHNPQCQIYSMFFQHFSAPEMPTKLWEGGHLPMPAVVRKAAKQNKTKCLHHPSSAMILIDEGCCEIHSWWPVLSIAQLSSETWRI